MWTLIFTSSPIHNQFCGFVDQKYLDEWPNRFSDVAVLQHLGAGVAPWTLGSTRFSKRNGRVIVNERTRLMFYQFHGFRVLRH